MLTAAAAPRKRLPFFAIDAASLQVYARCRCRCRLWRHSATRATLDAMPLPRFATLLRYAFCHMPSHTAKKRQRYERADMLPLYYACRQR